MENNKRGAREGEDEDEMKMEKFYALLRSFRHARDRRRRELLELEKHESNSWKKMMKGTATTATTDNKAEVYFEFQDFTTEIQFRKPPLVFPNPVSSCHTSKDNYKDKKKKKEQQDLALDLKLAL